MFRCIKAPREPVFPAELAKLGFQLKDGQFVDKNGAHFQYFHTDNERVNDLRKEAMHICARKAVVDELKEKYAIHEFFLYGITGTFISTGPTIGPHVTILATNLPELRKRKDIIVVVGQDGIGQDAGIWAYRVLMREGGIEAGSVVGMAAKLAARGHTIRQSKLAAVTIKESGGAVEQLKPEQQEQEVNLTRLSAGSSTKPVQNNDIPGLVVLNNGQLIYSHIENKPMSLPTWHARRRETALHKGFELDEEYYCVPNHENPLNHTKTVLEDIIPRLTNQDARLYMVCIEDGAEVALAVLDQAFAGNKTTWLQQHLKAVAFIQPYFDPASLVSPRLHKFMAVHGKSWIESSLPRGSLIRTPGSETPNIFVEKMCSADISGPNESDSDCGKQLNNTTPGNDIGSAKLKTPPDVQNHLPAPCLGDEFEDGLLEDYAQEQVVCPTFSAGECDGIVETVFPKVLDEVLDFFWHVQGESMM